MRVLVDESLPRQLATELTGHDAVSVRQQGWNGLRNGVLLRAAVAAGFQVFITADQDLRHQQNLPDIGIAVITLVRMRNRIEDIRARIPAIVRQLETIAPGAAVEIGP